jgi:hypothetical protein
MIQLDGSPVATTTTLVAPVALEAPFELSAGWDQAIGHDEELCTIYKAVQEGHRKLPPRLLLKLSIAEYSIVNDRLTFRNRLWVPKRLRIGLIQATHDSLVHVHPGREGLYTILAR